MDRHICKAKDIKTGEWVYGYYVALPDEYTHGQDMVHAIFTLECEHVCMGEYKDIGWHEVDPETVCQCTGLSDKNRTVIFENDCIGHKLNVVEYFNGSFCVNGDTPLCYMNKYYQVVGNKFDYGVLNNG